MNLLDEALSFAVRAHSGQNRKKDGGPYILHPLEAAVIVSTMTDDSEVIAAAALHDVVEDRGVSLEEIALRFGPRVAQLVGEETEDKRRGEPACDTWELRKRESLRRLKQAGSGAKMICLGDKLSNIRSLYRAWLREGDAIWESFNMKDPARQMWYYRSVLEELSELSDREPYRELAELVDRLFAGVSAGKEG